MIKLGIIGCGNVLEAYLPQCRKLHGRAELGLVCGRPHQENRALSLGASRFTTDEHEVIESSDVVLILTSMGQHARLARAALEAGKHVLLEKPLATNLAEAQALVRLAQESNRRLACGPFTLLSPTFQTMSARIRGGDIGKPCSARARYGWSGPWWSDWFYKPGGGCLFDLAVYCITTLTGLLGPARHVMAMTGVAIPEREINGRKVQVEAEDNVQVLLDFGSSTFAVVTSGFTLQQTKSPALEIYGTTGTLQMLGEDWSPRGYEWWQNEAGCWRLFNETNPDWSWTDGLRHLIECLEQGTPLTVNPEHALHVLEIMLRAQDSGRTGARCKIESTFTPPQFDRPQPAEAAHLRHDPTRGGEL